MICQINVPFISYIFKCEYIHLLETRTRQDVLINEKIMARFKPLFPYKINSEKTMI